MDYLLRESGETVLSQRVDRGGELGEAQGVVDVLPFQECEAPRTPCLPRDPKSEGPSYGPSPDTTGTQNVTFDSVVLW
jgi:hypothetical protein